MVLLAACSCLCKYKINVSSYYQNRVSRSARYLFAKGDGAMIITCVFKESFASVVLHIFVGGQNFSNSENECFRFVSLIFLLLKYSSHYDSSGMSAVSVARGRRMGASVDCSN